MKFLLSFLFLFFLSTGAFSFENPKIRIDNFLIHKYEVTIKEFANYAEKNNYTTLAEKTGGGYEWGAGWEKRKGWNYKTPFGKKPESLLEPAVHLNRFESENYCKSIGGRLPTFDEWKSAAYKQSLPSTVFQLNKVYAYPSGDKAEKMNSQGILSYDKHVDVTTLPEGINGLVAMGGNVWEWIANSKGDESLTAGASWWYGGSKTKESGAQYKPSNFYAIYVGFRCAFDK
jgi:formylglycine-generating enzyme required for sulfatase activity